MESPVSAAQSPDSQYGDQSRAFSRSNDKKFICNYLPECKAAFSRQEHLQRHIRKHTGERPFSCGCGRTFTRLDNLRQHAQTVHSGTEMAKISDEQNAIAAAKKMRPTPNSPPPRLDGGSDTDPYPRPVSKTPKPRVKQTKSDVKQERHVSPVVVTQAEPIQQPQPQQPQNPYETLAFLSEPLQTLSEPLHTQVDPTTFNTTNVPFSTYPGTLPNFTSNTYTPVMQYHEVESSVGSQPISSLAKRRPAKNDFVYTGGHMINSPGTIISTATDFEFGRNASDTTPDEGEQMSEYINNGLEAHFVKDRTLSMSERERIADGLSMLSELAAARRD